jgi:hypothetical protein
LYVSISFWNSCIESLYKAISTSCTIRSNHTSFSWIDLNENSLFQIDWHWISWFAVFFFETVKTMLFSVLDKLIIVIKMSIFSFLNLLFIVSLHLNELISVTKFFENMIILRLFHWIISFSFAVWALIFWLAILITFFAYYFRSRRRDWRRRDRRWSFFDTCMNFFWRLWFFHSLNSSRKMRIFLRVWHCCCWFD